MFKNFSEIESHVLKNNIKKKIALAGAHDEDALASVVHARQKGVIDAVLIGDTAKIKDLLVKLGDNADNYELLDIIPEAEAASKACELAHLKAVDIPMKGLMLTSTFMRAILDKQRGFVPEKGLLSQATVLEHVKQDRMMVISDCAINIAPTFDEKLKIINNAVKLANKLGDTTPKVAVLAAVEVVNPAIQATIDAAMLAKAAQRGQIKGCIVDGPFALDNAVSVEAAHHKGIEGPVAGVASVLIMPDLNAGNIFTKSLTFFGGLRSAGAVCGTAAPVIMTSRTDTPEIKYHSILTAILQAL